MAEKCSCCDGTGQIMLDGANYEPVECPACLGEEEPNAVDCVTAFNKRMGEFLDELEAEDDE